MLLGAVIFVVLFFRYQYFPDVFTSQGFLATNPDAYYRLHRIQTIIEQSGFFHFFYPLFDPHLNFPKGQMVAWPLGLDLFFAIPLKWLGVTNPTVVAFWILFLIPIFIIPILWMTYRIVREHAHWGYALAATLAVGIMPTMVNQTNVGALDHHIIGAIQILGVFLLLEKIKKSSKRKYVLVLGFILGVSPSFDPHAWFVVPMLLLHTCFHASVDSRKKVTQSLWLGSFISALLLMFSNRFTQGYISISGFSWLATIVLTGAAIFLNLVEWFLSKKMGSLLGAVAGLVLLLFLGGDRIYILSEQFGNGWNWLFHKSGTIGGTLESSSMFMFSFSQWHEFWLLFLMPIVYTYFFLQRKHIQLLVYSLIPIACTFLQIRFMTFAGSLIVILLVLFLYDLIHKTILSSRRGLFEGVVAACVLLCFYPHFPSIKYKTTDVVHSYYFPVREASKFLQKYVKAHPLQEKDVFEPAVIASWDFGHWIRYFSKLPVVASPFQDESADHVNQLLVSEDNHTVETFEKNHPARFLLVEQSIPRYYSLMQFVGKNMDDYYSVTYPNGVRKIMEKISVDDVYFHRFQFDLGTHKGTPPDHWRYIFMSHEHAPDVPTEPALKIFERVPSVTLKFETVQKNLYLEMKVLDRDRTYLLRKKGIQIGRNMVEWKIPYGQYHDGNVFCDGNFVITNEQNKIIRKLPTITDRQVLSGDTVSIK